ncbi:MAG: hypothetical protein IJD04_05200 [Desulfovibrionaceae bacterium]|nr:hypothetical protein [Desulfovibrionaceae bacterium]
MKWKAVLSGAIAGGLVFSSAALADPSVELYDSTFTIEEGVNDAIISQIKEEQSNVENMEELGFVLEEINNDDLAKICSLYPNMVELEVSAEAVTDISPVAKLTKLKKIDMEVEAADFSPLKGLVELTDLDVSSNVMGPDLSWMSGMNKLESITVYSEKPLSLTGIPALPGLDEINITGAVINDLTPLVDALPGLTKLNLTGTTISDLTPLAKLAKLTELNLYGATVKDFSPLAACPALTLLTYYGTNESDYSTLGKLTQLVTLEGGLTKLEKIDWVASLPNLRKIDFFAEYITDYSPLTQSKIEELQIWSMRVPVGDLAEVGKIASLKKLTLWDVQEAANSKALAGLSNLEEVEVRGFNNEEGTEPFDLSAASGWAMVKEAELAESTFINSDAMGAMTAMTELTISEANTASEQPFSLAFLAKLPDIRSLSISESKVSNFEAVSACTGLAYVRIEETEGITSLAPLHKLPELKRVTVDEGAFSESDLSGFSSEVDVVVN